MTSKHKFKEQNILHKLRNREVSGSFMKNVQTPSNKAKLLFGSIPPRFRFHLKAVIEDIGNHILMGMSQCGQFIFTYTFTMDHTQTNNRFIYGSSCFKYQLHWWRFRVNAPAVLVAEVRLFENQDIHDVLTIGIAQWPSISNKILIYGQSCPGPQHLDASEFRKIYITVTVNPSLNNCRDCLNIKRSLYEDISEDWNSSTSSRCLRHGLTVHTVFSVFPPFPPINLSFALKDENRIIVNTGNSLHVLFIDLEDNSCSNNETKMKPKETLVNEELRHRLGVTLALKGHDYKVPVMNQFADTSNEQLLPNQKKRLISRNKANKLKPCLQNSDCDNQCEYCKSDGDDSVSFRSTKRSKCSSVPLAVSKQAWLRQIANQIYDFAESDESCNLKFKWYRRRTIADKMYEFCSDDEEDTENIHPLSLHFGASNSLGILRPSNTVVCKEFASTAARKACDIDLEDGDRLSVTSQASDNSDFGDSHLAAVSPASRCNLEPSNLLAREKCRVYDNETENSSNVNQNKANYSKTVGGSSQLNITCDSVWLDWETTSLSPCSDVSYSTTTSSECSELKLDSARSFLENLPTMGSSESYPPKCISPMAVKCYPSCATNKDRAKAKDTPTLKKFFCRENRLKSALKLRNCYSKFTGCGKEAKKATSPMANSKKTRKNTAQDRYLVPYTSTRFKKRFIEMDEEILSTVTDNDDEDGVNYALPLSVHGSGYSQMYVFSSNKVEKLNVPCCVIQQDSLDIEQFSYKMAVIICKCQGYKFWFCNDYDIEIVDVCSLNGDILAVVFLRINADPPTTKTTQVEQECAKETMDPRKFFETRCLFIWEAKSRACWLEAYTPLVEDSSLSSLNDNEAVQRNPARVEAQKLRTLGLGFFDVPLLRPIRSFEHLVLDNIRFGPSIQVIEDEFNMIGFFKEPEDMVSALADDEDDSLLRYNELHASADEEDDRLSHYDVDQIPSEDDDDYDENEDFSRL